MGWFSKLFGGKAEEEDTRSDELSKFSTAGWELGRAATSHAYLEAVGQGLGVEGLQVVPKPQDNEHDLRGTFKGFPLKVTIGDTGYLRDIVFKIGEKTNHRYIDLEFDPDMPDSPVQVDAFEPDDKQVILAPKIFLEGSDADEEAAEFRKLPAELQERVLREMRRLGIRYFRSRSFEFDITMHTSEAHEVANPVAWLVDTLNLAMDVTLARGQVPPGKDAQAPKQERTKSAPGYAKPLAESIARHVFGAKIVEKPGDEEIEIRWVEDGVPVRITVDYGFGDLDIQARADGVGTELSLAYDEDVTIAATTDSDDPWAEIDHYIFFAKHVYVSGRESVARSEAAIWQSLGPTLLDEVVGAVEKHRMTQLWLADEVLNGSIDNADEITDGGAEAVRVAKLVARVAKALPRGAVATQVKAVRCTYCHGLWFPSPSHVTCSHCGARA